MVRLLFLLDTLSDTLISQRLQGRETFCALCVHSHCLAASIRGKGATKG